ncbi:MAG: hypothetical protein H6641_19200 [Caldilineaceae bacterium]|nr:hypothetical protein [Caldilineaceae bacterium]
MSRTAPFQQTPTCWYERPQRSMLAYADYDRDGWVDFVTGDWSRGYTLYRNQGLKARSNLVDRA